MNDLNASNRLKLSFESILPVLLVLLLGWAFKWHFGSWINGDWHVVFYSRLVFWLIVALLFAYTHWLTRQPFLPWKEQPHPIKFYFNSVIVLYLLVIVAGIISAVPGLFGWHDNQQVMLKMIRLMSQWPALMVFGAATAGITEELLFRGFILPRLQLLLNSKAGAVILSSLMFAGLHYQYHSLHELIGTFLIGVIFAVHYQKHRNIKIVMIAHFMVDLIAFILGAYAQQHHLK